MGIELSRGEGSRDGSRDDAPRRAVLPEREVEVIGPNDLEPRLGATLPVLGWISDPAFQLFRFVGLGGWIVLYATLGPHGLWWVGFLAMWAWIAANVAYENESRRRRRLRRHYRRALKYALISPNPVLLRPEEPAHPAPVAPVAQSPAVSAAERALVVTVRRVDTAVDRFERTDVVLVHEVAELLGPLLLRIAERGGDPQVRHDLETLAGEHLPRTVEDFLALPADVARTSRNASGTTPAEELRTQLHLMVEGCRQLRDSVLSADVDRQQQQSRFLEAKFRRGDLDL
ncbi:hypothetical protein OG218_23170 [Kineococcus sp. NBC_00420]|uniref:hypothetical protein n=1 Tax=Kineococcus sp. NBC_00420 TaxID=2903564 RepID=UPI002E1F68A4